MPTNCTILVPAESLATYRSADVWKNYANIHSIINIDDTFTAPVPCGDGTVALTFKITSLEPLEVEVSGCPSGLTGALTIPASVQDDEGRTFAVTGIGAEAFKEQAGLTSVTLSEGITAIGANAFEGTALATVSLPSTLTAIGTEAFKMSDLESVVIPDGVTSIGASAFSDCGNLQSVTLGSGITSIGSGAFYRCDNLTSVTANMPTPVAITSNVFSNRANATLYVSLDSKEAYAAANNWKSFKNITGNIIFADANVKALCVANWDANGDGELSEEEATAVTSLGKVFKNNSQITSFNELEYFTGLTEIGNESFFWCFNLSSITIPENVEGIGTDAFNWCSSLADVEIPESVATIGQQAFRACWSFNNINIPNSVTNIGDGAFYECKKLSAVSIPASVTSIGERVFGYCSNLKSIFVAGNNEIYDSRNNCNAIIETSTNKLIAGCQNTVIPNSVTSIGSYAFYECSGLTSVTIPESVTSIGSYAFSDCSGLTRADFASIESFCNIRFENSFSNPLFYAHHLFINGEEVKDVVIPDGIEHIGRSLFTKASITSVIIPNSVTSIEKCAFEYCEELTLIEWGQNITAIGDYSFCGCTSLASLNIPESVTTIGLHAFENCSSLTSVTVNWDTPLTIASNVFSNRANATLYVPFPTKYLYEAADYWKEFKEIVQMEGPVAIGDTFPAPVPNNDGTVDLTFKVTNLSPLEVEVSASPEDIAGALTIPATVQHESGFVFAVKAIGENAFLNRNGLTSIVIEQGVEVIGYHAFENDANITSVLLPESITSIYGASFFACSKLSSINIPASVRLIDHQAFRGCSALKTIELPEGLTQINSHAFRDSGLESIKFLSTLTSVGHEAFRDCKSLTSIDFNHCSANFEYESFLGCSSLEELYIPNTVKFLNNDGSWAWGNFQHCSSLRSVVFEAFEEGQQRWSTTSVFADCSALETVVLPSTSVMQNGFFARCDNLRSVTFLEISDDFTPRTYNFSKMFQILDPNKIYFTVPEGHAEELLKAGYINISDLSALPMARAEFETQASRITTMMNALSDGDKTTLTAAISSARSAANTAEDYATVYAQITAIKTAAKTYLSTATLPDGFDMTAAMLSNPDFDQLQLGWDINQYWVTYPNVHQRGWNEAAYENGDVSIDKFFDTWEQTTLGDGQISQTISALPAGNYRLEADIIATKQDDASVEVTGVSLFAGGAEVAVATENQKPQHFSVSFENKMTKDVKIGIDISSTNANWVAMDNVRLYYESAAADILLPSHTELASSETDTLYLYNVEDEAFLKAGNSWGTHAVLGDEGLPIRLTQDTETGLWQFYFWEGSRSTQLMFRGATDSDEIYVDYQGQGDDLTRWAFIPGVDGTYLIQNKTLEGTDKYMGNVPSRLDYQNQYSGETHTDVIATAASTENVHWLLMTKKQYDEYQRGLIYQNMLYADEALSVLPEGMATLKLNLKNEASVNMTDFYLQLPEGITIVDNASGKPDVTLNSSRSNGHVVTSQRNADGIYHIVCYSSKNGAFKSNDGLLFNIKLQCAAGTAAGSYTAVLKNILMSDVNKKEITQPDYTIDVEVPDLTLGDVNDDSRINGLDIVEMVDRIMQRPSDTFHFLAADLNFDSKINALDLVKLIALVLNQGVTPTAGNHAPAAGRTLQTEAEGLSLETAADGALTMGVAADDRFILTQCVVELEEGMQLEGVTTDDSHTAVWQQLDDQRYAVLAYSTGNAAFAKNETLLSFVVKGQGHVSVTDALVVNEQREPMYLARADKDVATGIGNVNGNENVNVYDLGGRKYDDGKLHGGKLTKGVYIVNGKKVVVK